jgi:3-hydroxyisobutyrate dehydrogenase-like beta-hydroxyacid dehydrogenase
MTTIAILGLGEAGRLYACGLRDAGARVRGFDPYHPFVEPGVEQVETVAEAVSAADVVLSLVGAASALEVADAALDRMAAAAVYADLNTASPGVKAHIAAAALESGLRMADVAVLAPVPRAGHRTPLLASGDGAAALAELLVPLGVPIDVLDAPAGEAARLRLLRSTFMKGLAALVIEGVGAAQAVGAEDWMRDQIARELGPDGHALVDRLIDGTYRHAARREHEVRAALAELEASGRHADMTRATLAWFERFLSEPGARPDQAV